MIDTGAGHIIVYSWTCHVSEMLDTGGAFVMFMSRAVREFNLQNDLDKNVKT